MTLGVQANASTQCEWFCVTVEYRLYFQLKHQQVLFTDHFHPSHLLQAVSSINYVFVTSTSLRQLGIAKTARDFSQYRRSPGGVFRAETLEEAEGLVAGNCLRDCSNGGSCIRSKSGFILLLNNCYYWNPLFQYIRFLDSRHVYGQFHQNLLQSRRIQFLLILLISLSKLINTHIWIIISVDLKVVFLKWYEFCMLDIFVKLILRNNENKYENSK